MQNTQTASTDQPERKVVGVYDAATVYEAHRPLRYEVEWFDFDAETTRGETFTDLTSAKEFAVKKG